MNAKTTKLIFAVGALLLAFWTSIGFAEGANKATTEILGAGFLAPSLTANVRDVLGPSEDVLVVRLSITNNDTSAYSIDQLNSVVLVYGDSRIPVKGVFLSPSFLFDQNIIIKTSAHWLAWYNLADTTNIDYGTHVCLPTEATTVTISPAHKLELVLLFATTARLPHDCILRIPGCGDVKLPESNIVSSDKWSEMCSSGLSGIGAQNFIPREALPGAVLEDGLPALTMWGKKWRARKGPTNGAGLVYFRQIGSQSMPFGGAAKFATEIAWE
jgi:hypothetical protein